MNIGIPILKLLAFARAFVYLYITLESFLLGFMYWNAYKKYKTTPIIKAVQRLLLSIGIVFFYLTIIALISSIDSNNALYDFAVAFIPLLAIPLVFSLIDFREKSTDEVSKDGHHLVGSYKLKKTLKK